MLRIVLPGVAAASQRVHAVSAAIAASDVCVVKVAVKVIVVVNVDGVVAAPSASITPTSAPHRAHRHADAEGNCHPGCIVSGRWVGDWRVWVGRLTVNYCWVVARNVNDFRIGLLNYNNAFRFNDLRFDLHLFGRFQIAVIFGFEAHALDRVHHVRLLRQKRIAQIGGPLDVFHHLRDDVRQPCQPLDAGIPVFLCDCVGERLVFQVLVLGYPLLELDQLQRIGGCGQNLRQQRVGVQRDGRNQAISLIRGYFGGGFRRPAGARRRRRTLLRH